MDSSRRRKRHRPRPAGNQRLGRRGEHGAIGSRRCRHKSPEVPGHTSLHHTYPEQHRPIHRRTRLRRCWWFGILLRQRRFPGCMDSRRLHRPRLVCRYILHWRRHPPPYSHPRRHRARRRDGSRFAGALVCRAHISVITRQSPGTVAGRSLAQVSGGAGVSVITG